MEKINYLTQLPLENSDFTTDIDEQFFPYEGQQLLVLIKFPGGAIDAFKGIGTTLMDGDVKNVIDKNVGLFLHCKVGSFQIRKSFFFITLITNERNEEITVSNESLRTVECVLIDSQY